MANKQKLTNEEIEDVVNTLPPILAALPKVANKVREQIQNKIRLQLKDVMMIKTPESLKKLKEINPGSIIKLECQYDRDNNLRFY